MKTTVNINQARNPIDIFYRKFPSMATLSNRYPVFVCQCHQNVPYHSKCI